jgi:hypothetical protein
MYLIEVLIMLSEDENDKVATAATNGLQLYSEKCETDCGKSLLEVLEDNFYNLVTKLPRILHGTGNLYIRNFVLPGTFCINIFEILPTNSLCSNVSIVNLPVNNCA